MRKIPESIGRFTPRELFLLNCIRDLEERVEKAERNSSRRVKPNRLLSVAWWLR